MFQWLKNWMHPKKEMGDDRRQAFVQAAFDHFKANPDSQCVIGDHTGKIIKVIKREVVNEDRGDGR